MPAASPADGDTLHLVRLLVARIFLALLGLLITLGLDVLIVEIQPRSLQGLYGTLVVAFGSALLSALWLPRVRRVGRFSLLQIMLDVGLVTSLVYFSGAQESVFNFLYLIVILYGAILYERRGALWAATLSTLAYGALLATSVHGAALGVQESFSSLGGPLQNWLVQAGAFYLTGALGSFLSREASRTGRALDRSKSDLERLRELHEQTVTSLGSGILTTDEEGRVTSWNPEAVRITGTESGWAMGRDVESLLPGAREFLAESGHRGESQRESPRRRIAYMRPGGEEVFLGARAWDLESRDGRSRGYVLIFQDVTRVVAMEQELRASERLAAVGEMAARIAHEVRNPLASISGSIQLLGAEGEGVGREESARLMEIVLGETDRLNVLITYFLQYSRPAPPRFEEVNLHECLQDMLNLLRGGISSDVRLSIDCPVGLQLSADSDQLRQVFWNLAQNALQAMPGGGGLEFRVAKISSESSQGMTDFGRRRQKKVNLGHSESRGFVEVIVTDTGAGIRAEDRERIFEPFFTTKSEGTGLGLATVHRIVEAHGGSIRVAAPAAGGTSFRIRLPGGWK